MGKKRYIVKIIQRDDSLTVYHVWDLLEVSDVANLKSYEAYGVWVGYDGTPACAVCYGPLQAMLRSCVHAKAVKRYIKKFRDR